MKEIERKSVSVPVIRIESSGELLDPGLIGALERHAGRCRVAIGATHSAANQSVIERHVRSWERSWSVDEQRYRWLHDDGRRLTDLDEFEAHMSRARAYWEGAPA